MKVKVLLTAVCFTAVATVAAAPAHAEWVNRVTDGIMGTRITVELILRALGAGRFAPLLNFKGCLSVTTASPSGTKPTTPRSVC